jgi:hypothetical protein
MLARSVTDNPLCQQADRERSREAGIDHHFLKPTNLFVLQALLSRSTPKNRS